MLGFLNRCENVYKIYIEVVFVSKSCILDIVNKSIIFVYYQ